MKAKGALGLLACASAVLLTAPVWSADTTPVSPYKTPPSTGALAQDLGYTGDVRVLADSLKQIRSSMGQMRDNNADARATLDPGMADNYLSDNRWLLNTTMMEIARVLDAMRYSSMGAAPATQAAMNTSSSDSTPGAEWGTASQRMYATESDDAAFIRNALQDINGKLNGYSLRGDPYIALNRRDMNLIDAAISHSENPEPDRSVAYNSIKARLDAEENKIVSEQPQVAQAPETAPSVSTETHSETTTTTTPAPAPPPAPAPETNAAPPPAPAPEASTNQSTTTETTTTTESNNTGGGSLPRTGGEPLAAYALGSLLIGLGIRLRRRR